MKLGGELLSWTLFCSMLASSSCAPSGFCFVLLLFSVVYTQEAARVVCNNLSYCFCSVIQFCATAFAYYAQATAAQEIFGHTLQSLRGIKYLYKLVPVVVVVVCVFFSSQFLTQRTLILLGSKLKVKPRLHYCRYNVFQIAFICLAGLTFVYYAAFVSICQFSSHNTSIWILLSLRI